MITISNFFGVSIDDLLKSDIDDVHLSNFTDTGKIHVKSTPKSTPISTPNYVNYSSKDPPQWVSDLQKDCKRMEETIRQKDMLITALQGQIDALKIATNQMEARLQENKSLRRKAG